MKIGKTEVFAHFNLRWNLYIQSHPAVDNEGKVVSVRNVAQCRKNSFYMVQAKTTESELCSMMQTQTQPVQIQNYLYELNVDTLPTHSASTLKRNIKMASGRLSWFYLNLWFYTLQTARSACLNEFGSVLQRDKSLKVKE